MGFENNILLYNFLLVLSPLGRAKIFWCMDPFSLHIEKDTFSQNFSFLMWYRWRTEHLYQHPYVRVLTYPLVLHSLWWISSVSGAGIIFCATISFTFLNHFFGMVKNTDGWQHIVDSKFGKCLDIVHWVPRVGLTITMLSNEI